MQVVPHLEHARLQQRAVEPATLARHIHHADLGFSTREVAGRVAEVEVQVNDQHPFGCLGEQVGQVGHEKGGATAALGRHERVQRAFVVHKP
ncbi:hypothetical protein D9M68_813960 [compost metagenome]